MDTIVERAGRRELVSMRWGLIPRWWSKTLKDVKMATFNARAETVETKRFFRDAFERTRCLIPVSGSTDHSMATRHYFDWLGPCGIVTAEKRFQLALRRPDAGCPSIPRFSLPVIRDCRSVNISRLVRRDVAEQRGVNAMT